MALPDPKDFPDFSGGELLEALDDPNTAFNAHDLERWRQECLHEQRDIFYCLCEFQFDYESAWRVEGHAVRGAMVDTSVKSTWTACGHLSRVDTDGKRNKRLSTNDQPGWSLSSISAKKLQQRLGCVRGAVYDLRSKTINTYILDCFTAAYNRGWGCVIGNRYFIADNFPQPADFQKPKTRRKKMSRENYSLAVFLVSTKVRAIKCAYKTNDKGEPVNDHGELSESQVYTFKSLDESVKEGDLVLVPTTSRFGLCVVEVVECDVEVDPDSTANFKWIMGKVDISAGEQAIAMEAELINRMKQQRVRERRTKALQAMAGADNIDDLKALPIFDVELSDKTAPKEVPDDAS